MSVAGKLAGLVEGAPPRSVAAIDAVLAALDAYLSTSAPESPLVDPAAGGPP